MTRVLYAAGLTSQQDVLRAQGERTRLLQQRRRALGLPKKEAQTGVPAKAGSLESEVEVRYGDVDGVDIA